MLTQERSPLQPTQVSRATKLVVPHVEGAERTTLLSSAVSWGRSRHNFLSLTAQGESVLSPILADIEYGRTQLKVADVNTRITTNFVSHPEKRLRGQWSAFWKGKRWIASIQAEREAVEAFMSESQAKLASAREEQRKAHPLVEGAREDVKNAEDRLFNLWEVVTVKTMPLSVGYLGIVPERTNPLIERYGETFGLDGQRVPDISGFTATIARYIQRYAGLKGYQELAEGKLPLLEIPAKDLPRPVREALKGWTSFNFAYNLYAAGHLSEEPKLSNFLKA